MIAMPAVPTSNCAMIPSEVGASTGQAVILALMHVVAAAVIIPMLTILARPNAR